MRLRPGNRQRTTMPRAKANKRQVRRPSSLTLLDAVADDALFAPWFSRDPKSWQAWFSFLRAAFGLPMSKEQRAIYEQCTGRTDSPNTIAREVYLCCGRRSGKSFMLALIAVYLAAFFNYRPYLARGEKGTVMVIAAERKQARTIVRYIGALLTEVPSLKQLVVRQWSEGFELRSGIVIEIATASFRSLRGYTLVAALLDEAAFYSSDENSASPDTEILNGVKPGFATVPNAMLLVASSPYARRGILWDAYKSHYAKDNDPVLFWKSATRVMNPSVPQQLIDEALRKDPSAAAAEWLGEFRADIESFLDPNAIAACVSTGVYERPPERGVKYQGFVDAAGGSGADSFTAAIAHKDNATGLAVLDVIREFRPPFSPDSVIAELARLFKAYRIRTARADRYAGGFPTESFRAHNITLAQSAAPKSDLYRDFLPAIMSRQVDLLDNARLASQLVGLERKVGRSGRDVIDHGPNQHDDLSNAVAGVIVGLTAKTYNYDSSLKWVGSASEFQRQRRNYHIFGGRLL